MMRVRGFAAGAIAAGLMVTMSGCGGDGGSSGAPGGGHAAALTQANFTRTVTTAQQGAKSAHIDAAIKVAGQSVTISGDVSGLTGFASTKMDLKVEAAGKHLELRLVHKTLYLRGAGGAPGKPWVEVGLNDPANPLSKVLGTAGPQSLSMYLQAVKSLRDRGTETVNGVTTHHYTVTIDTAKALAANPAFKGQDLSKLGMPKTLTTDAWLDSQNRPVKLTVAIAKLFTFEASISKYGEPVTVNAPPPGKVHTLSFHLPG